MELQPARHVVRIVRSVVVSSVRGCVFPFGAVVSSGVVADQSMQLLMPRQSIPSHPRLAIQQTQSRTSRAPQQRTDADGEDGEDWGIVGRSQW